jgi:hypothetical protein
MVIHKDYAQDVFRVMILEALDKAAREIFGHFPKAMSSLTGSGIGASDADLPYLFPSIDAQISRLAERYAAVLVDE